VKIAIVGASGKTGAELVGQALDRGYETVAVCRDASVRKLDPFADRAGLTVLSAPVVSNETLLTRSLAGCDAVVAVSISVRRLKATELVSALVRATEANGVKRLAFTAGEATVAAEAGDEPTLRQRLMFPAFTVLTWFTAYSLGDMRRASSLIKRQVDWEWTIVRAPTLTDGAPVGYRFCRLPEITWKHVLSRKDYAACLLDVLRQPAEGLQDVFRGHATNLREGFPATSSTTMLPDAIEVMQPSVRKDAAVTSPSRTRRKISMVSPQGLGLLNELVELGHGDITVLAREALSSELPRL
jgi:putative NADH-flavin reductase